MNDSFTLNNEACQFSELSCRRNSAHMLPVVDWLSDLPENIQQTDLVEVQFKNTRKIYFHNAEHLPLEKGVKVITEANPGYDLGEVTLTGKLVLMQMQKNHIDLSRYEIRNVLRLATEEDLLHAQEAHAKEQETMIKSRQLAKSLGLEMKIGDVEYQGDGTKAIFYYIADGRVDFRQLIKVYAETFRIRIEMKQIGARQEAGRIGGTGPCGRELCCSTWMTQFTSVGTGAARLQNVSPNPQKLAGQCAKLKCCLNYEVPVYEDARKNGKTIGTPVINESEEQDLGFQNAVGEGDVSRFDRKKHARHNDHGGSGDRRNNKHSHPHHNNSDNKGGNSNEKKPHHHRPAAQ